MGQHGGPSGAIVAVAATLSANLNTWLDAVWSDWGNDTATYPKVYPKGVYVHWQPVRAEYPHLQVYPPAGRLALDHAADWGWWEHQVVVEWWLQGDNEVTVQEQASRYGWAVWRCLANQQQLDGSIAGLSGVTVESYEFGARESPVKGRILRGGRMPLVVQVDEHT